MDKLKYKLIKLFISIFVLFFSFFILIFSSNDLLYAEGEITVNFTPLKSETYTKSKEVTILIEETSILSSEYSWSTSTLTPTEWEDSFNNEEVLIKDGLNGTYYLHVRLIDDSNNIFTTYSGPYNFDNTPVEFTINETLLNEHKLKINVESEEISGENSGLNKIEATIINSNPLIKINCNPNEECLSLDYYGKISVLIVAIDNAGNISEEKEVLISRPMGVFAENMVSYIDDDLGEVSPGDYINLKVDDVTAKFNASNNALSILNEGVYANSFPINHLVNAFYGYKNENKNAYIDSLQIEFRYEINDISTKKIDNYLMFDAINNKCIPNDSCSRKDYLKIYPRIYNVPQEALAIQVYVLDVTPKVSELTPVEYFSLNVEYKDDFLLQKIIFKSFYDEIIDNENVVTTIKYKGKVVESIDTTKLGRYEVRTIATDNNGVKSFPLIRIISVKDTIKPTISLIGKEIITLKRGSVYLDEGIDVYDNYDGTKIVKSNDKINYNKVGTHIITYYYQDSSGNISDILTRTVIIEYDYATLIITLTMSFLTIGGYVFYFLIKKKQINKTKT